MQSISKEDFDDIMLMEGMFFLVGSDHSGNRLTLRFDHRSYAHADAVLGDRLGRLEVELSGVEGSRVELHGDPDAENLVWLDVPREKARPDAGPTYELRLKDEDAPFDLVTFIGRFCLLVDQSFGPSVNPMALLGPIELSPVGVSRVPNFPLVVGPKPAIDIAKNLLRATHIKTRHQRGDDETPKGQWMLRYNGTEVAYRHREIRYAFDDARAG